MTFAKMSVLNSIAVVCFCLHLNYKLQSLTKLLGTKLRCLSNYCPRSSCTVLKHQICFLDTGATNTETGVGVWDHVLQKASALHTQKGEFQCMKINKITILQRSVFLDFVPTNFVKIVD